MTPIYEDNTACIEWGNVVIGGRERANSAKHIDIWKHFAHKVTQNGAIIKVPTAQQMADILTKGQTSTASSCIRRWALGMEVGTKH